jgi:MoaA/NifB/PqqE/SkfB family radical SAM enzyme
MGNEFTLKETKNLLKQCKDGGVLLFHIAGGEPTLCPFLPEIIDEAKKLGLPISLTSNSYLLNTKRIKELINSGIKNICLSIESSNPKINDYLRGRQGAFNQVISTTKKIKEIDNSIKVNFNTVINKKNYKNLKNVIDLANELNVDSVNFFPIESIYPFNYCLKQDTELIFNTKQDIDDLKIEMNDLYKYASKKKMPTLSKKFFKLIPDYYNKTLKPGLCSGGKIVCEIDAEGNVYPCNGNRIHMGNIRKDNLSKIWNSQNAKVIRKKLEKCNQCWDNCQAEPKIRLSLKHILKNPIKTIEEYKRFFN